MKPPGAEALPAWNAQGHTAGMGERGRKVGIFVMLVALYVAGGGYSTLLIESPGQVALFWP